MPDAEPRENSRGQSEGQARPVKRSRTGCLTCRTRRRKCDERRPICQNCIAKGLECRYAATFQFLGKNNYTPVVESHVKYASVEFVADGDEVSRDATGERRLVEPSGNLSAVNSIEVDATLGTQLSSPHTNLNIVPQRLELQQTTDHTTSANRYEFAVNGLLALSGTEPTFVSQSHEVELPEIAARQESDTPIIDTLAMDDESCRNDTHTQHTWGTNIRLQRQIPEERTQAIAVADYALFETNSADFAGRQDIAYNADDERTVNLTPNTAKLVHPTWSRSLGVMPMHDDMDLIRQFRYGIAPWLDICDDSQPFGVMVLVASVDSTRVRESILNLARANKTKACIHGTDDAERGTVQHELQVLVPRIFHLLEKVVVDLANFWEDSESIQTGSDILVMLLPQLKSATLFTEAAYWLIVRLIMGCAIMSTTPLRIPLPFLAHSRLPSTVDVALFELTQNAMALTVDAIMFSHGDDDRWLQQRYGSNRVDVWKTLLHGLGLWYRSRPQEFQPIIELYPKDGIENDHDFPTIVFTSGAALLANQLYHTAMVLLLQHKPRFDTRIGSTSTSMSRMWHIHRICGIAINNDGPATWDPSLVASLIVAARAVTHKSQQLAVLCALENAQMLTGWSVLRHLEDLSTDCV